MKTRILLVLSLMLAWIVQAGVAPFPVGSLSLTGPATGNASNGFVNLNTLGLAGISTAQRLAISASNGLICLDTNLNQFMEYINGWQSIGGGGAATNASLVNGVVGPVTLQGSGITTNGGGVFTISGGGLPGDGTTIITNGNGQYQVAPGVTNSSETITGAQTLATNATNFALSLGSKVWPQTVFVSTGGSDTNVGTNALWPVLTITNAVRIASNLSLTAPTLIQLGVGNFPMQSNTFLTTNMGLHGVPGVTTITLSGSPIGSTINGTPTWWLECFGDNIDLDGFSIGTNTANGLYYFPLTLLGGTNINVRRVNMTGDSDAMIAGSYSPLTNLVVAEFDDCTFVSGYDTVAFSALNGRSGPETNSILTFNRDTFTINSDANFPAVKDHGISQAVGTVIVRDCVFNVTNSVSTNLMYGLAIGTGATGLGAARHDYETNLVAFMKGNTFNLTNTQLAANAVPVNVNSSTATLNVIGAINPANILNGPNGVHSTNGTINYDAIAASYFVGTVGASNLTGALPALSGAALTGLTPSALTGSGTAPTAAIVTSGTAPGYMLVTDAALNIVATNEVSVTVNNLVTTGTNNITNNLPGGLPWLITNNAANLSNYPFATYAGDGPPGIANFDGTTIIIAGTDANGIEYFGVDGANLTGLPASAISTGIMATNHLPGNLADVQKMGPTNLFMVTNIASGSVASNLIATVAAAVGGGGITLAQAEAGVGMTNGNGAGLTNIQGSAIVGTISNVTFTNVTLTGTANIAAAAINSGTLAQARMVTSGANTANAIFATDANGNAVVTNGAFAPVLNGGNITNVQHAIITIGGDTGSAQTISASARYLKPCASISVSQGGTEGNSEFYFGTSVTITGLYAWSISGSIPLGVGTNITFTSRSNTVSTAQTCTVNGTSTTYGMVVNSDLAHPITLPAGTWYDVLYQPNYPTVASVTACFSIVYYNNY